LLYERVCQMQNNTLIIQTYIAAENDVEFQLTLNSQEKINHMNQASNDTQKIHDKYGAEEEYIQNEMNDVSEDQTSEEYQDLLSELNSLEEEEDEKVEKIEKEETIYENQVDTENTQLETKLEAMKQDREGFENAREQDIEKTFGYFQ